MSDEPTKEQAQILRSKGWRTAPGLWYKCRVCGMETDQRQLAWFSPRGAAYHVWHVLQSPQVKKLLKEAVRDATE